MTAKCRKCGQRFEWSAGAGYARDERGYLCSMGCELGEKTAEIKSLQAELSRIHESSRLSAEQRELIIGLARSHDYAAPYDESSFRDSRHKTTADTLRAAITALDSLAADRLAVLALGKTPIEQSEATVAASSLAQWVKTRFVHVEEFNALFARLADVERDYHELWCAVWCCPVEEYQRVDVPGDDGGATHAETCAEAQRQAMRLADVERERDELRGLLVDAVRTSDECNASCFTEQFDEKNQAWRRLWDAACALSQSRAAKEG